MAKLKQVQVLAVAIFFFSFFF